MRERWRLDLATEDDESLVRPIVSHGNGKYAELDMAMSSPIGHSRALNRAREEFLARISVKLSRPLDWLVVADHSDQMRRTGVPEEIPDSVPPELVRYLGTYHLAQAQTDFTLVYHEGALKLRQSGVDRPIGLRAAEADGRWVDEFGRDLHFVGVDAETAAELALEVITGFERTDTAAGVEAALDAERSAAWVLECAPTR